MRIDWSAAGSIAMRETPSSPERSLSQRSLPRGSIGTALPSSSSASTSVVGALPATLSLTTAFVEGSTVSATWSNGSSHACASRVVASAENAELPRITTFACPSTFVSSETSSTAYGASDSAAIG